MSNANSRTEQAIQKFNNEESNPYIIQPDLSIVHKQSGNPVTGAGQILVDYYMSSALLNKK